jgi:hypothetical protein
VGEETFDLDGELTVLLLLVLVELRVLRGGSQSSEILARSRSSNLLSSHEATTTRRDAATHLGSLDNLAVDLCLVERDASFVDTLPGHASATSRQVCQPTCSLSLSLSLLLPPVVAHLPVDDATRLDGRGTTDFESPDHGSSDLRGRARLRASCPSSGRCHGAVAGVDRWVGEVNAGGGWKGGKTGGTLPLSLSQSRLAPTSALGSCALTTRSFRIKIVFSSSHLSSHEGSKR